MSASKVMLKLDTLFTKYLLTTNVVTCGALLGIGDALVQGMNIAMTKDKKEKFDYARTGRMIVIGLSLGPFNHYWYALLDKVIKGNSGKAVLYKILSDQFIAGPFFCSTFLCGLSFLEGKGMEGAIQEWKDKFLGIYFVDWMFWPAAQFVNFKFVPGKFRVAYVSTATLIWNSFLSYAKHRHFCCWFLCFEIHNISLLIVDVSRNSYYRQIDRHLDRQVSPTEEDFR